MDGDQPWSLNAAAQSMPPLLSLTVETGSTLTFFWTPSKVSVQWQHAFQETIWTWQRRPGITVIITSGKMCKSCPAVWWSFGECDNSRSHGDSGVEASERHKKRPTPSKWKFSKTSLLTLNADKRNKCCLMTAVGLPLPAISN